MQTEIMTAGARGTIYKQLSRGFLYPGDRLAADLASGEYLARLTGTAEELGFRAETPFLSPDLTDLASDYVYYFDIGNSQPPCAPYGGIYLQAERRSTTLVHLSEVYKNFGLDIADDPHELQDHLGVELEFIYFLCFKEARALQEGEPQLTGYRRAQRDFLERHFSQWLPAFALTVEKKCRNQFYRNLAAWCLEFVNFDLSLCQRQEW